MGYYRDPASGDAMLSTGAGLDGTSQVIEYPGNGGTTRLTKFGGENPDPTKSCPTAYRSGAGLPLFAVLPTAPTGGSHATLTEAGKDLDVCVVDASNFNASDPVYGSTAQQYFDNGLVLITPREPLVPGDDTVTLSPGGQSDISWTFHSRPKAMPPSLGYAALCSYTNPAYASGQAQIGISNPLDTTRAATYTVTMGGKVKTVTVKDGKSGHTKPFTHLRAKKTYSVSAVGDDHTSATRKVTIPACPAWSAFRPSPGGSYSAAKHRINQPVSNRRNLAAVTLKVRRSHMTTLKFHIKGKAKKTLHIGVHKHGATKLTYVIGKHRLATVTFRAP